MADYVWNPLETAPTHGRFFVKGGEYNTAYSQIDGFSHTGPTLIHYRTQVNPDVDPPYRVEGEAGLGILNPTHWAPAT